MDLPLNKTSSPRHWFRSAVWTLLAILAGLALWVCAFALEPATLTAPRRPHFTDIAPRSHISYVTDNDYSQRKYFIQPMCGGVAIFDYDNDGKMDIFFTNGAKLPELKKIDRPSITVCCVTKVTERLRM